MSAETARKSRTKKCIIGQPNMSVYKEVNRVGWLAGWEEGGGGWPGDGW